MDKVTDLGIESKSQELTTPQISDILKQRYSKKTCQTYTRIGEKCLISINPIVSLDIDNDENMQKYIELYRKSSQDRPDPHIFELVMNSHNHMKQTGLNQSIVFMGLSGSGKTESRRLAIRMLSYLRWYSKRDMSLYDRIIDADTVIEAFSHAKTSIHSNASRMGLYTELQFDKNGSIRGARYMDYILDQKRIVAVKPLERSFHVLYYLALGASEKEKTSFGLTLPSYEYLNRPESINKLVGINDSTQFAALKSSLNSLGFGDKLSTCIFKTLSIILLLGNLAFEDPKDTTNTEQAAKIKNTSLLLHVSGLLGVDPDSLESSMVYKSRVLKNDQFTMYLDSQQASDQRDALASLLYSLLLKWIIKKINYRLNVPDFSLDSHTFIGILDLPGFQNLANGNGFQELSINYANERLLHFINHQIFVVGNTDFESEQIANIINVVEFSNNTPTIDLLIKPKSGIFPLIDRVSRFARKTESAQPNPRSHDALLARDIVKNNPSYFEQSAPTSDFYINHFSSQTDYSTSGFFVSNDQKIPSEFISLFFDSSEFTVSCDPFIQLLFHKSFILTETHSNVTTSHLILTPQQPPTTHETQTNVSSIPYCVATMYHKSIGKLISALDETIPWFVFNISQNDKMIPNSWDQAYINFQLEALSIPKIAFRKQTEFVASLLHSSFINRYSQIISPLEIDSTSTKIQKIELLQLKMGWHKADISIGKTRTFLSFKAWNYLESKTTQLLISEQDGFDPNTHLSDEDLLSIYSDEQDEQAEYYDFNETDDPDLNEIEIKLERQQLAVEETVQLPENSPNITLRTETTAPTTPIPTFPSAFQNIPTESPNQVVHPIPPPESSLINTPESNETGKPGIDSMLKTQLINEVPNPSVEKSNIPPKLTASRIYWLIIVWLITWWIPSPFLSFFAGLKHKDQRIAWREKVALCFFIALFCGITIFWIAVLGIMICPKQKIYTIEELGGYNNADNAMVAIRGEVFGIKDFFHAGVDYKYLVDNNYPGKDVTSIFPIQLSFVCSGLNIDSRLSMSPKPQMFSDAYYHDQRLWKNPNMLKTGGYNFYQYRVMKIMREKYFKGNIGIPMNKVQQDSISIKDSPDQKKYWAVINHQVFDLTDYINHQGAPYSIAPDGYSNDTTTREFIDPSIQDLFYQYSGQDITEKWDRFFSKDPDLKKTYYNCFRGAFFAGIIDKRKSFQCYFANYMLLSSSIALTSIILFKFLAALQLGSQREPEDHENFVICNVPCYTEGEESLRSTLESLATLRYDDRRKLLFIICDGMIMGSGNDRPTPRIVLDILGADHEAGCIPLSFQSLGEGSKQHNMGKVYSGLYEVSGHVVPYLVIVKCGSPSERFRQGNRGKRDSQIILMRFFNKVHFDLEMTPLELEIYHQIKNIIGVDPAYYEFIMMVDADTYVFPESLNRMVSCMVHDSKLMGICGETKLANEKETWVTMVQVYEYYLSHHLSKAFESLFGSVTCLPGCFSMYRIQASESEYPLLINNSVLKDYSENRVDTLHKKNLLSLGEDRYLTTLMLKHLPYYKMKFTPDAQCRTNAPDTWKILLSQRRRWINSTVHNLLELVFLPRLCGFCCFSMRFIVFIDLFSTIIMPATVAYLGYLIYVLVTWTSDIPLISIMLLVSVYAMQVLLFIIKKQWQHIGWMIVYFFAIPIFSLFIPLYSFWHFDDFSWGNTRVVVGDGQKRSLLKDDVDFDPSIIPKRKWSDYEAEAMSEIKNGKNGTENVFSQSVSEATSTGYSPSNNGSVYSTNFYNRNNPMLVMHNGPQYGGNPGSGIIRNDSYEGRVMGSMQDIGNIHPGEYPNGGIYEHPRSVVSPLGFGRMYPNPEILYNPTPVNVHQLSLQQQIQQQQQQLYAQAFSQQQIQQQYPQHQLYQHHLQQHQHQQHQLQQHHLQQHQLQQHQFQQQQLHQHHQQQINQQYQSQQHQNPSFQEMQLRQLNPVGSHQSQNVSSDAGIHHKPKD
ncbi:Chitin synthase 8 [Smittium mucronatum]|uniref:chitin synthase n=1 Tax=Smittium mucronatum TaxID=133383 RepID=A0A1R0GTZ5_9FUNG|nr:Chitin synthase 8 [Smittium mucronatum]